MLRRITLAFAPLALVARPAVAQDQPRPLSPNGSASAQVLGKWVKGDKPAFAVGGAHYQDGKWIDITYGRPLLRGREVFGKGADYGKALLIGAPIWRAGANVSTR